MMMERVLLCEPVDVERVYYCDFTVLRSADDFLRISSDMISF